MPRYLIAGVCLWSLCANAAEPTKLSFMCKDEDIQWAGLTCSESDPCPVYLEISGIADSRHGIFLAGNLHSAQSTLYSILLNSSDGGVTWTEPVERVRGEDLDYVQFHSFDTGWVSGQRTAPLLGDPFFLLTRDGGKTWRKQAVLPDGAVGSILQFRFDSATSGKVLIDHHANDDEDLRYKLLETSNGGETWSLRESSATPIKNGPVPEEDPVYRLHPQPGGKILDIQKRSGDKGDKWTTIASFLIQIATCNSVSQ
jgi:photosystem II stability/assembly factor-like uncharacterized protein